MTRRSIAAAIAVAALCALVAAPHAEAKTLRTPKCAAKHSKTVLASGSARVWTREATGGRDVFACLYKKGRSYRLGFADECQNETQATDYRLAGSYIGYVETSCGLVSGDDGVVVRNLKTGKVKWAASAATGTPAPNDEASTYVTDLELKRDGSIVWIGAYDANSSGMNQDKQVRKLEPNAPAGGVLVDQGIDVVTGSLALSSTTPPSGLTLYYWMRGGVSKADTLK